jgi:hypothetical protein
VEEDFYTAQEAALLFSASCRAARGIVKFTARKPRQGWRQSPVGTEGGKPRPDNGPPNLTVRPLSVVNIRCSIFKGRDSMRADVCFDAATEWATGGMLICCPPVVLAKRRAGAK